MEGDLALPWEQERRRPTVQVLQIIFDLDSVTRSPPAGVTFKGCYRIDGVAFSDRSSTEYDIPPCMCVTHCKMNHPNKLFAGSYNEYKSLILRQQNVVHSEIARDWCKCFVELPGYKKSSSYCDQDCTGGLSSSVTCGSDYARDGPQYASFYEEN